MKYPSGASFTDYQNEECVATGVAITLSLLFSFAGG
jgi:hypothetical protein